MTAADDRYETLRTLERTLAAVLSSSGTTYVVRDAAGGVANVRELPHFRQWMTVARELDRLERTRRVPTFFDR